MKVPLPNNETERLAALREYRILDTEAEKTYDDIAGLAAYVCQAPISMVSLVDEERQWFKSRVGIERRETPREVAFCAHAILVRKPFVVPDAKRDRLFSGNPLVTGEPRVRFYAGFPLINPEGLALGTLCVMDRKPRRLSSPQKKVMQVLARQVLALLEARRVAMRLANVLDQVKTLQGLLPICAWCKRIRDDDGYWNQVEAYFHKHSGVDFTHSICPECLEKVRPQKDAADGRPRQTQG